MGGVTNGSVLLNDVWNSTDGVNWNEVTGAAEFTPRGLFNCVVYGGAMWVISGEDSLGLEPDAWYSFDGNIWTKATSNGGFTGRYNSASVVFNNHMWIIAGYTDVAGGPVSDVWFSP